MNWKWLQSLEDVVARFSYETYKQTYDNIYLVPRPHYSARPMRFRSCGTNANEFERVWTLFVSLTSPKCIDREQTRQREQREQSIYQLFWYLSASVALGIYFKNSLETKWSHLGPKPFQSFSPWLYVTPCYTWKLNYFGSNFKLKKN